MPPDSAPARSLIFFSFIALALILIVFLSRAPLGASFWLDETISVWIVKDSLRDAVSRSLRFQGQSPLYFSGLWCLRQLLGSSELMLHTSSLIFLLLSGWTIYALGKLLFDAELGSFALLSLLAIDTVLISAIGVRPYAAALSMALLSTYYLVKWQKLGHPKYLCISLAALALTFYLHYLFLGVVLVHFAYLFSNRPAKGSLTPVCIAAIALFALMLLPGACHFMSLLGKRSSLAFVPAPTALELVKSALPVPLLIYTLCGILLALIWKRGKLEFSSRKSALYLIAIWAFTPPILFFLLSHVSGSSVFVDRYFLWSAPGLAFLSAACLRSVTPLQARRIGLIVFAGLFLFHESGRIWNVEDWRGVLEKVAAAERGETQTGSLLIYTGLIEAEALASTARGETRDYLLAPVETYYHGKQTASPIPAVPNREELERILGREQGNEEFYFVSAYKERLTASGEKKKVHEEYLHYFSELGYTSLPLVDSGQVLAFHLSRRHG